MSETASVAPQRNAPQRDAPHRTVTISSLRFPSDDEIPQRRNPWLKNRYVQAMRVYGGWGEFPPILVDQTGLVLGGRHRVEAAHELGIDEIPVLVRECADDKERLLVAAEDNATHGEPWSAQDFARICVAAERLRIVPVEIARRLRVSEKKVVTVPVITVARRNETARRAATLRAAAHRTVTAPDSPELRSATPRGAPHRSASHRTVTDASPPNKTYIKTPARAALASRDAITEEDEARLRRISGVSAERHLRDLIDLYELGALPPLNNDSARLLQRASEVLRAWHARDARLVNTPAELIA